MSAWKDDPFEVVAVEESDEFAELTEVSAAAPLEPLAVSTPRPQVNLILYCRVSTPRAAWRAALVAATSRAVDTSPSKRPWSYTKTRAGRRRD